MVYKQKINITFFQWRISLNEKYWFNTAADVIYWSKSSPTGYHKTRSQYERILSSLGIVLMISVDKRFHGGPERAYINFPYHYQKIFSAPLLHQTSHGGTIVENI